MPTATRLLFSDERGCGQFVGEFEIDSQQSGTVWKTTISHLSDFQGPARGVKREKLALEETTAVAMTPTAVVSGGPVESVEFDPEEDATLVWAEQTVSEGFQ